MIFHRWEDEYYAAYKKYSGLMHLNDTNYGEKNILKASSPEKFVLAITRSADKLLGKKISSKKRKRKPGENFHLRFTITTTI